MLCVRGYNYTAYVKHYLVMLKAMSADYTLLVCTGT